MALLLSDDQVSEEGSFHLGFWKLESGSNP